jgi:hypothetical protein
MISTTNKITLISGAVAGGGIFLITYPYLGGWPALILGIGGAIVAGEVVHSELSLTLGIFKKIF